MTNMANTQTFLTELLEWVSANCYDYGHGLLPGSGFVVDAIPLIEKIARIHQMTDKEMTQLYDRARFNAQWKRLHKEGEIEAHGGPDWDRIIQKWLATDREGHIDRFIIAEVQK